MAALSLITPLVPTENFEDPQFDGVIVVADNLDQVSALATPLIRAIEAHQKVDQACVDKKEPVLIVTDAVPSKRLIFSPTGPTDRDYDDVRLFQEAGFRGMKRALAAGCKAPLMIRAEHKKFTLAGRVACLGALHALYTPIEVREACPDKARKVEKMGIWGETVNIPEYMILCLNALESGRLVARDIGGSDPERMAAPKAAEYIENTFKDTCIKVNVISDIATLEKEYPLLVAVNRAARNVARHAPRVVFLEYQGEDPIDMTALVVGKGITYDTGGADLKVGGAMAGMHRDKCGAAAVAGLFQCLSVWKPKGIKVIGACAFVRNSVGSEGYVSDEIITSRAGVRVRIGNTDAEGRMVMGDVLCQMKERALTEAFPYLFTIATLTGHVVRSYGTSYSAVLDNGPAAKDGVAGKLQRAGDAAGDPFEISTLRREDYEFMKGKSEYEDVVQSNTKPSSMTNRGHQAPAAFLNMVSGLDKHGNNSEKPLPYSHLDIAGSAGDMPDIPTAAPVIALGHAFGLIRESATIIRPEHAH